MKRLLIVLPFLLAACEQSTTAPAARNSAVPTFSASGNNSCTVPVHFVPTVVAKGYDEFGYNRCAGMFNGTMAGYCSARGAAADCGGTTGDTKLVMKWNSGWDLGNTEGWTSASYDAWIDNEFHGAYADGTPFSEHFKAKWDLGCLSSGGVTSTGGGTCIWGQFAVLMDQGTEDGTHIWWAKFSPGGFGG